MTDAVAPYSVSEFLFEVNALLETQVVWVEGEVSDYRVADGKWVHFDLKDAAALVHCFGLAFRLKAPLEDGMRVRLWGAPRVYPKYGKFSLVVERVEPFGEGALQRAFELLRATLEREGLFAAERKRRLPRIPERIALITSPDAAAYADFLTVLERRRGGMEIVLLPVTVQGERAVDEIVRAIQWVSEERPDLDALVLVRGGGSLSDLQAFSDETLIRALARSRVPTMVGVGHERDVTLADLVADVRAATPSNAAERLTPTRAELMREVHEYAGRMTRAVEKELRANMDRVALAVGVLREAVRDPVVRLETYAQAIVRHGAVLTTRVAGLQSAVDGSRRALGLRIRHAFDVDAARVGVLIRLLAGLHPTQTLRRGYSITRGPTGRLIRAARDVEPGDRLSTTLHHGTVDSTVTPTHQ